MVFRKRRSTSFSKDESKTSADVPVERSNGNRNWFDQSKRDIRKVERTKKRKEKKGKMPSSHLQSQRLIGGKVFFSFLPDLQTQLLKKYPTNRVAFEDLFWNVQLLL